MIIKDAALTDIPEMESIEKSIFSEPWNKEGFESAISQPSVLCVVAKEDFSDELLGYVICYTALDEGEIVNVAVSKDHRRKGVAKSMMERVLDRAKGNGIVYFALDVRVSNEGAIRLYESFGFKTAGVRKNFYRFPTEDSFTMILELNNA